MRCTVNVITYSLVSTCANKFRWSSTFYVWNLSGLCIRGALRGDSFFALLARSIILLNILCYHIETATFHDKYHTNIICTYDSKIYVGLSYVWIELCLAQYSSSDNSKFYTSTHIQIRFIIRLDSNSNWIFSVDILYSYHVLTFSSVVVCLAHQT